MALTFSANIGGTVFNITNTVRIDSVKRHRSLFNDSLEPTTNSLAFQVARNSSFLNALLLSTGDVSITVLDDTTPWFFGYLTENYSFQIQQNGNGPIKLQAEDPGIKKMKKAIISLGGVYTDLTGRDICNPSTPSNSAIHILAALAGFTVDPGIIAIARPIPQLILSDDETPEYWQTIHDLCFEHGYIFGFSGEGKLYLYDLNRPTISTANIFTTYGSGKNIFGRPEIKRKRREYKQVEVIWDSIEVIDSAIVFSDTTGGDSTHKCNIPLNASEYYPKGASASSVDFSDYKLEDGTEVLSADSVATDFTFDVGILSEFTNMGRKAKLKFQNTSGSIKNIQKLDIIGTNVHIKGAKNKTRVGENSDDRLLKIESKYIDNLPDAKIIANIIEQHYRFSAFQYGVKSRTVYQPGDLVRIYDPIFSGIDIYAVIVETEDGAETAMIDYTCFGISAFDITATVDTTTANEGLGVNNPLGPNSLIYTGLDDRPTYGEITSGFVNPGTGATNNPASLPAPTLSGSIKNTTATLRWTKSALLTGQDIQVKIKRAETLLGTYATIATVFDVTTFMDADLSLAGTPEIPLAKNYYYKVCYSNSLGDGPDSSPITLEAYPIEEGQLSALSISAGKLKTDVLNALIAQIAEYLVISNTHGFVAGPDANSGLDEGDLRTYLDQDEIKIQEWRLGAWEDLIAMTVTGSPGTRESTITAWAATGVKRRGLRITQSTIEYLNASGVSVARIAKTGNGNNSVILDGDFRANINSPIGVESNITAAYSHSPNRIQLENSQLRIAYRLNVSPYNIVEKIWSVSAWGSATNISETNSDFPNYIERSNGELRIAYRRGSDSYLVEKIWNGTAWGSELPINEASSSYPKYLEDGTRTLRIAYMRGSDSYLVERIWNGTAWGNELTINDGVSTDIAYTKTLIGQLRIAYMKSSPSALVERTLAGSTWSAASPITSGTCNTPNYLNMEDKTLWITYTRISDGYLVKKSWDGSAWGSEVVLISASIGYANAIKKADGDISFSYIRYSDNYLCERTLPLYATIGHAITAVSCIYKRITSSQALSTTPVNFLGNSLVEDTHNAYKTTTGVFTVPTGCDGHYEGNFSISLTGSYGNTLYAGLLINGTELYVMNKSNIVVNDAMEFSFKTPRLNVGDTIAVRIWVSSTANSYYDGKFNYIQIARSGD
jgi:hypothetical protein